MKVVKNYLHIGVETPFCVLHASDTHLTFADERDCDRKILLAKNRSFIFPDAASNLTFIAEKSLRENRTVIYTGDLIDFVSVLNLEKAKDFTDKVDCFMSAGNHEFSLFVGEAKEDAAYREQSLSKVQASFKNDIRCSSRIINGVNFVAIDNSYYLVEQYQLDFLKRQALRGLPIILCVHTPLYSYSFYNNNKEGAGKPAYLMSVPEEMMLDYSSDRYEQQKADSVTEEAYSYILSCDNIKAVLCGHIHMDFDDHINKNIYQIATDVATVREIYID